MKIGSLFDGSGGFPLAATICGIEPVWAAEIEPYPIAVTRSRFPNMKHLGSVTDIRGDEIEPVDVITFGSPCQDLSVAGKRAGLKHTENGDDETTRSGLFMEAIRIIKEMREATNGVYPRIAVWENVPGAFSSNKGEDFRIVLEEFIKVVEPTATMPSVPKSGWAYSDVYCGDGWSLAYRVLDAQYWGVPQRRRRIYLVADFRGQRAGKISFEREGLRGYLAESGTQREAVAGDAEGGVGTANREGIDVTAFSFDSLASNSMKSANPHSGCRQTEVSKCLDTTNPDPSKNQGGVAVGEAVGLDIYNLAVTGGQAATVSANSCMTATRNGPSVMIPYTLKIRSGCEGGGKGALIQENMSATLATNNDQYLFLPVCSSGEVAGTLDASYFKGCGMRQGVEREYVVESVVLDDQGGSQISVRYDGKSPTLRAEMHGNVPSVIEPVTFEPGIAAREGGHIYTGVSGTLRANAGDNQMAVAYSFDPGASRDVGVLFIEEIAKTLTNGTCPGHHDGVVIAEAVAKDPIVLDRAFFNQGQNALYEPQYYEDGTVPTLVAKGPSAVAYWDGSQTCGTLTANNAGGSQRMPDKENFNCVIEERIYPTHDEVHEFIADNNADAPHQQDLLQTPDGVARTIACGTHASGSHLTKTVINLGVRYIVRRLTPTECARLQGFPDEWGHIDQKADFTDEEYDFWLEVRNTHAAINGKVVKDYTKAQMLTWYNKLHTDSAEYKLWGNGVALPCVLYIMEGIAEALNEK